MERSKDKILLFILLPLTVLAAGVAAFCAFLYFQDDKSETPQLTAASAASELPKATPALDADTTMLTMGVGEVCGLPSGEAYASDNTDVLTVDGESVKAVAEGYATLSHGGKSCYVTVKAAPSAVTFRNSDITLQKGERAALYLLPENENEGFAVAAFRSDDSAIVSVSPDGTAVADAVGSVIVTASCYNGCSAALNITVLDNTGFTERTTIADTVLTADAAWSAPKLQDVPAGTAVQEYGASSDGRWRKVRCGDSFGWIYNKAVEEVVNYTDYTLETLPVMADDLIFKVGTDKRALFDFVYIKLPITPMRTTPPKSFAWTISIPSAARATPTRRCSAISTTAAAVKPCGWWARAPMSVQACTRGA